MSKNVRDKINQIIEELIVISDILSSGEEQELVEEAIDKLRSAVEEI